MNERESDAVLVFMLLQLVLDAMIVWRLWPL